MSIEKRRRFLADRLAYWATEETKAINARDDGRQEVCARWRAVCQRALAGLDARSQATASR